jgi:signal transduction histidine kinase
MTRLHRSVQILMQTTVDTFIGEYTQTIERQTERLRSFNRTVSHELRNPLGTLQLALALVQRESSRPDAPRWFGVMQRNVEHMVHLIRDLEQLSRAGTALDTPTQQRIEVAAVGQEVARQLSEMAGPRGVEVVIAPDLPTLHVDAARLELVLMNLVSNAVKYADPAKPRRLVTIRRAESPSGTCAIVVEDNGLGIPADAMTHVFERFFRAHASQDEKLGNEGSGLGLAIVRECVDAMKGEIRVDSAAGVGTTFVLTLPDQAEPPA